MSNEKWREVRCIKGSSGHERQKNKVRRLNLFMAKEEVQMVPMKRQSKHKQMLQWTTDRAEMAEDRDVIAKSDVSEMLREPIS